jgi:hypothetical protein
MENQKKEGNSNLSYHSSLRLLFSYSKGAFQLEKITKIQMLCPPGQVEFLTPKKHIGYWLELQSEDKAPLFQRVLHHPQLHSVESFEPDGTIQRIFGEMPATTFDVLVPDIPNARSIAVMGFDLPLSEKRKSKTDKAGKAVPQVRELCQFSIPQ